MIADAIPRQTWYYAQASIRIVVEEAERLHTLKYARAMRYLSARSGSVRVRRRQTQECAAVRVMR